MLSSFAQVTKKDFPQEHLNYYTREMERGINKQERCSDSQGLVIKFWEKNPDQKL